MPEDINFAATSCLEQCQALYNAYLGLLSGRGKVRVRYNDMWVEYRANTAGDMDRLLAAYRALRNGCPAALDALPDLSSAARVRRGPPVGFA